MKDIFSQFDLSTLSQMQGVFSSLFILETRLQTACEKIQTNITMKQWLLLALLETIEEEKTLSNVGRHMGCSRQNIKKLASSLEKKGYLTMLPGENNSVLLKSTIKAKEYNISMSERQEKTLSLLFSEMEEQEIRTLFSLIQKLFDGVEKVESYGEECK